MSSYKYGDIYGACNHIASKLSSVSSIVDLGARHGESYAAFGRNFPNASYVFVEPSPRCITHVRRVIEENSAKDIKLIEGVLGTEDSEIDFFILSEDNDQSGNLFSDRLRVYGEATKCKVKMFDFRKIFSMKIDFVKCNIEGGEYDLIEQGFFDRVDAFVMEAHNQHVPGKTYIDVVRSLSSEFDLEVWGNVNYKYCFINGNRKR